MVVFLKAMPFGNIRYRQYQLTSGLVVAGGRIWHFETDSPGQPKPQPPPGGGVLEMKRAGLWGWIGGPGWGVGQVVVIGCTFSFSDVHFPLHF